MQPLESLQMNIYHSDTYRKDLIWLNIDDEPRVQERQQRKDQQSYISVFVADLTISSRSKEHQAINDNSILCMAEW